MMSSPETAKLNELLRKKIQLMEKLLEYAGQQAELSYIDNSVNYENIVESRNITIEEIKKVNIGLQQKLANLGKLDAETERSLHQANDRIADLAQQVIVLDRKSQAVISGEMQTVKDKLQALQKGRKGIIGYDANATFSSAGTFTDSRR